MRFRPLVLPLLLLCCLLSVLAKEAQPNSDDPELEKRVTNLAKELRCLVCQNETLADSQADLAEDLRREIRAHIRAGKSDKEGVEFLAVRHGQFVLYRPPVQPTSYLLWFGPFVLLLGGLLILFRYIKQRRDAIVEQPLTVEQRRKAEALLRSPSGKETV